MTAYTSVIGSNGVPGCYLCRIKGILPVIAQNKPSVPWSYGVWSATPRSICCELFCLKSCPSLWNGWSVHVSRSCNVWKASAGLNLPNRLISQIAVQTWQAAIKRNWPEMKILSSHFFDPSFRYLHVHPVCKYQQWFRRPRACNLLFLLAHKLLHNHELTSISERLNQYEGSQPQVKFENSIFTRFLAIRFWNRCVSFGR